MTFGSQILIALIAAACASALYVFIINAGWNWRQFFAIALAGTVVIFVLLTGGLIKVG
jgi:uncharacterized membrane protein